MNSYQVRTDIKLDLLIQWRERKQECTTSHVTRLPLLTVIFDKLGK